ncbi:MAG TPA: stage II sporulation protein M [Bacteroidales bacterium]|nr:stage II sporulation protein M [Bacteroidales bacterium]
MKESKFVDQNKAKWQDYERDLRNKESRAARLSQLFIQVTDDLSYARTFYKNRSVKIYLNGLAQKLFNDLYRNQTGSWAAFIRFWKFDLPMLVHDCRKEFRISFIVFLLAFGIGVLSSYYDLNFARLILGERYVEMTIQNIKNNDPLAVYKDGDKTFMFLYITFNNLRVALETFVLGCFFSIGTLFRLIYNGIMLGTFQYFFIERGLFKESFLTVWQHGTLEISCIIIAGAAGITLGKGLLFPGTYSRTQSFKISAFRGLKIFIGIAPIIVLAAFIESFFTRFTELNDYVRLMVILFSLAFVLIYFVWYPWFLAKRHPMPLLKTDKVTFKQEPVFDFSGIMTADEMMGSAFRYIMQHKVWIMLMTMGFALVHASLALADDIVNGFGGQDSLVYNIFQTNTLNLHFFCGLFTLSIMQYLVVLRIHKLLGHPFNQGFSHRFKLVLSSVIISFVLLGINYLNPFVTVIITVVLPSFAFLLVYQGYAEQRFLPLGGTIALLSRSWGKLLWNSAKIFIFLAIFFMLLNTPLINSYLQSLYMGFGKDTIVSHRIHLFMVTFTNIALFALFYVFQIITSAISYYAFLETATAKSLKQRIEKLGKRNIIFGFEKEG